MRTGLAGILVLGSNGEAPLLDADEAFRAAAAVRERVPSDRTLIVGADNTAISGRVVLLDGAIRSLPKSSISVCRRATANCVDEENNVKGEGWVDTNSQRTGLRRNMMTITLS